MKDNEKVIVKTSNDWPVGRVFWGLLFILIGGLVLCENFGWAKVYWDDLWRLWPLTVISAGLSILSVQKVIWKILAIVLALVSLISIALVALLGSSTNDLPSKCNQIQFDKDGVHLFIES